MLSVFIAAFALPVAAQAKQPVVVIGDSLTVGVAPYLRSPAWSMTISARVGRRTETGLAILASMPRRRHLVLALGTNDGANDVALTQRMARRGLAHVGPHGCVVLTTLYDRHRAHERQNRWLRRLAASNERVQLVDWAQRVHAQPSLIAGDGVHATASGYRVRARMTLAALARCPR